MASGEETCSEAKETKLWGESPGDRTKQKTFLSWLGKKDYVILFGHTLIQPIQTRFPYVTTYRKQGTSGVHKMEQRVLLMAHHLQGVDWMNYCLITCSDGVWAYLIHIFTFHGTMYNASSQNCLHGFFLKHIVWTGSMAPFCNKDHYTKDQVNIWFYHFISSCSSCETR